MTPQEREARLRAARRLQDDIYQGIGATDRPDVDGRRPTSAAGSRARGEARDSATRMTRAGTQPLRDLLDTDSGVSGRMAQRDLDADEDDSQVMMRAKAGSGKQDSGKQDSARRPMSRSGMGQPPSPEREAFLRLREDERRDAERRRAADAIPPKDWR